MSDTATTGPAAGQPGPVPATGEQPPAPAPAVPPAPPTNVSAQAAAPAPAPVDMNALVSELVPQLVPALASQLAGLVKVPQAPTGQAAPAATVVTWGDASAVFTKGELVSHGYHSHLHGSDVVRFGIVVAITPATDEAPPGYTVAWLAENSDPVPASELRAV